MLHVTAVATKPVISLPIKGVDMSQLPQQAVYGAIISGLAIVLFVLLLIYVIRKPEKKVEVKRTTPAEDLQVKHLKELKDALVKELRGTSKQNNVMIILTVIFIFITIFGSSIFIILQKLPSFALNLTNFFKALLGR